MQISTFDSHVNTMTLELSTEAWENCTLSADRASVYNFIPRFWFALKNTGVVMLRDNWDTLTGG